MLRSLVIILASALSAFAQTASYPSAVATDTQLFVATDRAQTTLSTAIDGSATTLVVKDASRFHVNQLITIDDRPGTWEIAVVCAVTANTMTIGATTSSCPNVDGRGFSGTTAIPHNVGSVVSAFMTAWHHNAMAAEVKAIENALGPNLSHVQANLPIVATGVFDFQPQVPGVPLAAGNNAITMSPVPRGVNGTNRYHYLYVSGGTGTAEACLITGGAGVDGDASGQIIVNCPSGHTGAWQIKSATGGFQEAIYSLPATGGTVQGSCGSTPLYQTLSIGIGSGFTQSDRQNVTLIGCGAGRDENFTAATDLSWQGPSGGTMVRFQGPIYSGGLSDLRLNGNSSAGLLLDLYATSLASFRRVGLVAGGVNSLALRLDAGADFNANTQLNSFQDLYIRAASSGASGIFIGPTDLNYNAGNFANRFENIAIIFANDTSSSNAITLGWADNNVFISSGTQAVNPSGPGCALKHIRQPPGSAGNDFLPSENTFIHVSLAGTTAICGDSGRGIGTIYWPFQVFDSGGIPNSKNHRGFLDNGDFFDTSRKLAFQNELRVYAREALAQFSISGFTYLAATGTVTTTGQSVVGSGTIFLTQLKKGKLINWGNEFRSVAQIIDDTHAILDVAFSDDLPAGSRIGYQVGSNMVFYSDGDGNIATQDATNLRFKTNGVDRLRIGGTNGNTTATGAVTYVAADSVVSASPGSTILASQIINGHWRRAGGGAQTDTTPTAAQIVAEIPGCSPGQTFEFNVYNNSAGLHTLGLGAGVTADSGLVVNLNTTNLNVHRFIFRVTSITPGSEAVVVLSAGQTAY